MDNRATDGARCVMPKLSQPIMAALAELHHARAAKVARTPGYARRLRNARKRVRYWEKVCAAVLS